MNMVRKSPASKKQFKCFQCRELIKSADGSWHTVNHQEVFLCKPCATAKSKEAKLAS